MKTHYDPKCEELAHWFLDDDDPKMRFEGDISELAGEIQRAIEDWTESREVAGLTGRPEPEDYSGQGEE